MRLFVCQGCGQPLHFENATCGSCGRRVGYLPRLTRMTRARAGRWRVSRAGRSGQELPVLRQCGIRELQLADRGATAAQSFCIACRHNRIIPDLAAATIWCCGAGSRSAKRRLFYSLLRLQLPLVTWVEDPAGLAFDFLAPTHQPVMTGHLNGAITINLAEADDSERERQRGAMGEPYRTLLGHFRHEIAHYYWDLLANNEALDRGISRGVRRRARGLRRGAAPASCGGSACGLVAALRLGLCERASVGGFRRDLGALLPHRRYARDRARLRRLDAAAGGERRGLGKPGRFRSLSAQPSIS